MTEITMKARRFDPRDDESIDLKHFDMIQVRRGIDRQITIKIDGDRLVISGNDALVIYPRGSNRIEIGI